MMYSSLISMMSGMNRFKGKIQHLTSLADGQPMEREFPNGQAGTFAAGRSLTQAWKTLEQVLVAMFLWAILGFAAGFLIGMLQAG